MKISKIEPMIAFFKLMMRIFAEFDILLTSSLESLGLDLRQVDFFYCTFRFSHRLFIFCTMIFFDYLK
ncbi:hypothetical protein BpHYR1_039489 [Brachionus plicatilis]|uniref:Uncharacterized protein n=1 Tax=Brachionus plicatilis TaxID=10195 RepID=A0A3M7PDC0_BRAPC|nr:hypothetical protein BpHYR1_039489 [Brachionus plicatilis]